MNNSILDSIEEAAEEAKDRLIHWILKESLPVIIAEVDTACLAAVEKVADLFERSLAGDEPSSAEWKEARHQAHKAYGHGFFGEGRESAWIAKMAAEGRDASLVVKQALAIGAQGLVERLDQFQKESNKD